MSAREPSTSTLSWGILGDSPAVRRWARWLATQDHQRVAAVWWPRASGAELAGLVNVVQLDSWADLLVKPRCDIVAVAAREWPDRRVALRELSDFGIPLLVEVPDMDAILDCELSMRQSERGVRIVPLFPEALHPWIHQLREWLAPPSSSPVGRIDEVSIERHGLPENARSADQAFAYDALLLRRVLGPMLQLQAMDAWTATSDRETAANHAGEGERHRREFRGGTDSARMRGIESGPARSASVHLRSAAGPIARWSLTPDHRSESPSDAQDDEVDSWARLAARGPFGSLWIELHGAPDDWSAGVDWTQRGDEAGSSPWSPAEDWDWHSPVLDEVQRCLSDQPLDWTWEEAYRGAELADLMELSARRGKTLDIHNQQVTERDTFKGVMSAVGCLLLVLTPLLLVVGVVLQSLLGPVTPDSIWRFWPVLAVLPLAVFLVLQTVLLVVPAKPTAKS